MGLDPGCGTEFLLAAQAVLCDGRFGVEDCGRLSAALGSLTLERVSRLPSLLTRRSLGLLGEVGEAGDFGFWETEEAQSWHPLSLRRKDSATSHVENYMVYMYIAAANTSV